MRTSRSRTGPPSGPPARSTTTGCRSASASTSTSWSSTSCGRSRSGPSPSTRRRAGCTGWTGRLLWP
uniref:Uncharacterized protein n=1 Tax=Arundo donax TaxID=35708 RepID=A0A0A9DZR4_ARUDO